MLPAPATRAVIYSAAPTAPAPAHAGPPVLAALKITASCGQRPCRACHGDCSAAPRPPRPAGSHRASPSCILHASPRPVRFPFPLSHRGSHSAPLIFSQARAEGRGMFSSLRSARLEITSPHTGTPRRNSCKSLALLSQAPAVAVGDDAATGSPPLAEWSAAGTKIAPAAATLAGSLAPRSRVPQLSRSWPAAFSWCGGW